MTFSIEGEKTLREKGKMFLRELLVLALLISKVWGNPLESGDENETEQQNDAPNQRFDYFLVEFPLMYSLEVFIAELTMMKTLTDSVIRLMKQKKIGVKSPKILNYVKIVHMAQIEMTSKKRRRMNGK